MNYKSKYYKYKNKYLELKNKLGGSEANYPKIVRPDITINKYKNPIDEVEEYNKLPVKQYGQVTYSKDCNSFIFSKEDKECWDIDEIILPNGYLSTYLPPIIKIREKYYDIFSSWSPKVNVLPIIESRFIFKDKSKLTPINILDKELYPEIDYNFSC